MTNLPLTSVLWIGLASLIGCASTTQAPVQSQLTVTASDLAKTFAFTIAKAHEPIVVQTNPVYDPSSTPNYSLLSISLYDGGNQLLATLSLKENECNNLLSYELSSPEQNGVAIEYKDDIALAAPITSLSLTYLESPARSRLYRIDLNNHSETLELKKTIRFAKIKPKQAMTLNTQNLIEKD